MPFAEGRHFYAETFTVGKEAMGDIEIAVTRCKRLETLLEEEFNAAGRGLHEKVSSVQDELPLPLVKRLRFIATVRNKVVHEAAVTGLENRRDYEAACDLAEKELKRLSRGGSAPITSMLNSTPVFIMLIVLLLALFIVALVLLGGFRVPTY